MMQDKMRGSVRNSIRYDSKESAQGMEDDFGDLPSWDLSDLYESEDSPELKADFDSLAVDIPEFAKDYEGKLDSLSGAEWLRCIERYEGIQNLQGRIMSFAGLRYYQQTTDAARGKFMADAQAKLTNLSSALVFFTLEINKIDEARLEKAFQENTKFSRYKPIFNRLRAMKPHQLSDELEKFLHDQSVVGATAWNRLFDETMASLQFEIDGENYPLEAVLTLTSDKNRIKREQATRALGAKLTENISLFSRITNTLIKEKEVEDRWREMPSAAHGRHLSNDVEPEVVEALRQSVTEAFPKISHRYYKLKAKWMGLDKLQTWDRNAPLPGDDDRKIMWQEARDIVQSAYHEFDPKMAEIAQPFYEKGWIDAAVKPGKAPGAFAHPTVTNVHPYVMLNYMGKTRDVMTLAHELGHGVHQVLAAKQGELLSDTPLTLAETASVFGEMLTFQKLLAQTSDPAARKRLLAGKVEDMINTVVRQISFYEFELRIHNARREGELTPDQINEIWMEVSKESLGDAFEFIDEYKTFWAYVPHFIHSPFYVYAYAFGDGLVNALYAVYREGLEGFEEKYFAMLEAGGSLHHSELLAPFGLDASDPNFWDKGLNMISEFIDELEALE